jgi:hypothetical protein
MPAPTAPRTVLFVREIAIVVPPSWWMVDPGDDVVRTVSTWSGPTSTTRKTHQSSTHDADGPTFFHRVS